MKLSNTKVLGILAEMGKTLEFGKRRDFGLVSTIEELKGIYIFSS